MECGPYTPCSRLGAAGAGVGAASTAAALTVAFFATTVLLANLLLLWGAAAWSRRRAERAACMPTPAAGRQHPGTRQEPVRQAHCHRMWLQTTPAHSWCAAARRGSWRGWPASLPLSSGGQGGSRRQQVGSVGDQGSGGGLSWAACSTFVPFNPFPPLTAFDESKSGAFPALEDCQSEYIRRPTDHIAVGPHIRAQRAHMPVSLNHMSLATLRKRVKQSSLEQ